MFGGKLKVGRDLIAETTILRFGERVDTVHCIVITCTICTGLHLWRMKINYKIVKVIESALRVQRTLPAPHLLLLH